jgi:hypothetical protein
MKIEIKNLKTCRGDETDAFSCTLWVEGRLVAHVRQSGRGGSHSIDWVDGAGKRVREHPVLAEVLAWMERERPACVADVDFAGDRWAREMAMELLVWDLVERAGEERMLRRVCKRNVVYRLVGDELGAWRTVLGTWAGNEANVRRSLQQRFGAKLEEIANERFAQPRV